jgi:hypothetical protein
MMHCQGIQDSQAHVTQMQLIHTHKHSILLTLISFDRSHFALRRRELSFSRNGLSHVSSLFCLFWHQTKRFKLASGHETNPVHAAQCLRGIPASPRHFATGAMADKVRAR